MLKKEALFGVNNRNSHIIMHISKIDKPIGDIDFYSVGWRANKFGKVNKIPFWYTQSGIIELHGIYGEGSFEIPPSQTYVVSDTKLKDFKDLIITVENNSVNTKLVGRTQTPIENDPLNLYGNIDKEVFVTFDPPPTGTYKEVKQVFTSSLKKGVVNAWERDAFFDKRYCECNSTQQKQIRRTGYCLGCRIKFFRVGKNWITLWYRFQNIPHEYSLQVCRSIILLTWRNFCRNTCKCESGRRQCKNNRLNQKCLRRSDWENRWLNDLNRSGVHAQ